MRSLAVLVFVALWLRRGEAVKCEDVISCTPDTSVMEMGQDVDIDAVCHSIQDAIRCFRTALKDCRATKSIPEKTLHNLESQINGYDDLIAAHCGGRSSSHNHGNGSQGRHGGVSDVRPSVVVICVITLLAAIL